MYATLHDRTHLGFLVHNLNQPNIGIDQEEIPQLVKGGVAYEAYPGVVTSFEMSNHLDHEVQYHGGIEFSVVDGLRPARRRPHQSQQADRRLRLHAPRRGRAIRILDRRRRARFDAPVRTVLRVGW